MVRSRRRKRAQYSRAAGALAQRHPTANLAKVVAAVAQVASALQIVPGAVRGWIQSGALKASRPGNGAQPGRKYRIRRADLDAFVAASEGWLALHRGPTVPPPGAVEERNGSPSEDHEVT